MSARRPSWSSCHHEVGHCWAARMVGVPIRAVVVYPAAGGHVDIINVDDLGAMLATKLGGYVCEVWSLGEKPTIQGFIGASNCCSDLEDVKGLLGSGFDGFVAEFAEGLIDALVIYFERNRDAIDDLAIALHERRVLKPGNIDAIIVRYELEESGLPRL